MIDKILIIFFIVFHTSLLFAQQENNIVSHHAMFQNLSSADIFTDIISTNMILTQNDIVDSLPADSIQDIELPKEKSMQEMQEEQINFIKRESKHNPAIYDSIYYKQRENEKAIQKDSTLKIQPDTTPTLEQFSTTQSYEFIIHYAFKLIDDIPYGEKYNISTPLNPLYLQTHFTQTKTCEINTKEKFFNLTIYPHYTSKEMQASIRKQIQYLLYNFLQEYKADVLECLILNQTRLDDMNTTINLQSRTKTLANIHSYLLVSFDGGILKLEVFNTKKLTNKKEHYENSNR